VLWDLDYNDAKLLAAWTGHLLCNAAEILRYTNAGWQQKDITAFSNMLMTVYYPLMRPYYPQANGNWDGAIIHSLIAMAVFTDNRALFNNAIDHFKHAPVNGSIFKYIYPSGQCQESPRDQGHVQLGIGEFAGAAQVAYTQGVDLFSIANNRIALGFEYTASFLLGEKPYCYCNISERAKVLRDDYEYVYRHYTAQGVDMPYTKKAADSVRYKASRSILTAVRTPSGKTVPGTGTPKASRIGYIAGAGATQNTIPDIPTDAINVSPGQSIQKALDSAAFTSSKWVIVKAGIHTFPATLKIPSGIILTGTGASTILFLDPASGDREAMINAGIDIHDVTIRDLVIEGCNKTDPGTDPNTYRSFKGGYNRGGILFRAGKDGQMQNISLINLTVRNATYSGVSISGAGNINITNCDFTENGASVPPGPKLNHNLLLAHCTGINISGSRLVTSPSGSGISLDHCSDVMVTNCEIARNGYYGVLIAESKNVVVKGNLVEGNDFSGIMAEFLFNGNENIAITNNRIQFNNGYGV
ncbi:MAG: right-handed parallel beta-helix repeat-containing protein, partial [Bacteroidota bacterium]